MIRVLVVASSAISRAGLESLVRADPRFTLVGDGYRPADLALLVREFQPDVLLVEAAEAPVLSRLPTPSQAPGAPPVVLLAAQFGRADLRRALQAGVRAVLPRDVSPVEIAAAIAAVAAGLAVVTAEDLETILPAASEVREDGAFVGEPLTTRESEVLALLAEGAGNKEIAMRLHISEHTVKFHVSSILAKLGAVSRTEAVARGLREGLIVL